MSPEPQDHDVAGVAALAEPVRRRLYDVVAGADAAVSREQAAQSAGVAVHTAKFHLDRLVDDGLLDAFVVPSMPLLEFAAVLQRISTGEHRSDGRLISFRAREFTLTFDRPVRANTDGEPLEVQECRYHTDPRALTFLCGDRPHTISPPVPW